MNERFHIGSLARTIRTVRYLTARQIAGQVHHRLRPLWERPDRFATQTSNALGACRWPAHREFLEPGSQTIRASNAMQGRFTFLNREERLGWPPKDWSNEGLPKLWQYNFHYFEWLWACDYAAGRRAILDWVDRHALAKGQIGWEPYPTSLRLMNWCALCFGRWRDEAESDDSFAFCLKNSVVEQSEWLRRHLETHLLGNHLLENGAALAFVGSAFSGPMADTWLSEGLSVLRREVKEQILPDGMHFERSPMYHLRVMHVLRLLSDTGHPELVSLAEGKLAHMREALSHLVHPDGDIALFNDSAFGVYNIPRDFLDVCTLAAGPWALPVSGYYGHRDSEGSYIICDAGPIGPDCLPGHAHGDTLSFELSLNGHRVLTDSGVFDYERSPMRQYCRSTSAHNTVEIGGQDQSEFWGAFRVGRRAYPRDVEWQPRTRGFRLSAGHTGYMRLTGKPIHRRVLEWDSGGTLRVCDRVSARQSVSAVSRLHLHPRCAVERAGDRRVTVQYPGGSFDVTFDGPGSLDVDKSYYCPEFGRREKRDVLAFSFAGKESEVSFTLASK